MPYKLFSLQLQREIEGLEDRFSVGDCLLIHRCLGTHPHLSDIDKEEECGSEGVECNVFKDDFLSGQNQI